MIDHTAQNLTNQSTSDSFCFFKNIEADPRVKDYWLVTGGPLKVGLILLTYLSFIFIIGPKIMKGRQAFRLKPLLIVHNFLLVLINAYFFVKSIYDSNYGLVLLETQYPPVDDFSPETLAKINVCYMYWISKFLDLFDTVFLVLRKKYSHITFLHVYHHSLVAFLGYVGCITRVTIPAIYLFMFINSLVHTLMYSYYMISAIGKRFRKYLWWKIYITRLQLFQFGIYLIYGVVLAQVQKGYPMGLYWAVYIQAILFLFMFRNFYSNCYNNTKVKIQ